MKTKIKIIFATVAASLCLSALADPPSHAPAHGWRKKHEAQHETYQQGYYPAPVVVQSSPKPVPNDYGILAGQCQSQKIAQIAGAGIGAVIGSQMGDGSILATIAGAALGGWLGGEVAKGLSNADQACFAQTLAMGKPGVPVSWSNPAYQYRLTPGVVNRHNGKSCRDIQFHTHSIHDGVDHMKKSKACEVAPGKWDIVG